MLGKLFRIISQRADELLVVAVVLVGAAIFYMPGVMSKLSSSGFAPIGAQSTQVREFIAQNVSRESASAIVILKSKTATVDSPEFQTAATQVIDQISKHHGVGGVQSYFNTGVQQLVAKDRKGALALVGIPGTVAEQEEVAASLRDTIKSDSLELAYAGEAILNHDITQQINKDLALAETISFALLAILLVIVFRGVVAALLPLLLGGFTVLVAFLVLRGLVEVTSIVEYALNVIILIGLGLAVDYSLLMVSRFREELVSQKGDVQEALRVTMVTAGRTIFFSGLTVIISLLALVVFPLDFLRSMGLGGAAAVLVAMAGALIVLPSMLRLLGHRVNWLSFGKAKQMDRAAREGGTHTEKESLWYKTGALFMRMPALFIVLALGLLLAGGMPFLRAKLTTPDYTVLPDGAVAREATESLRSDYAFTADPIKAIYTTSHASIAGPQATAELQAYLVELQKKEGVRSAAVTAATQGKEAVIDIGFSADAMSSEAQKLVTTLRASNPPNATVTFGGPTAELVDLLAVLAAHIPYALVIIGVTLFVLLFLMLGSVVLPLVAMVQNVLSLAVAFGALVWIFQEGHLAELLHMNVTGSIDATQPVLIFAVAFGLSMDYSVFLYGRIKEEYDRTRDNDTAVLNGLQKTGSIITSAAILLFVVVVAFATSRISIMQQIGVGLALAILVDAFLVRMVLVPATMKLLGRLNWWAPSAFKRFQARFGFSD
jgi:trehalose monomycolate/heme transporter